MSRILFWIILFGAGYWFWRRAKSAALRAAHPSAHGKSSGPMPDKRPSAGGFGQRGATSAPAQLAEPMERCAYCGAHSPRSETISQFQQAFCNQDHARRFASGERMADKG
jgi:uncharacterized protein